MSRFSPNFRRIPLAVAAVILTVAVLAACSPEEGSKEWCEDLKAKPKGDWTANEAGKFAKHCLL